MTTQPTARPTTGAWPPPHGDAIGSHAPGGPDNRTIPAISARGLTRVYDVPGRKDAQVAALGGVDIDLPAGSFTAVVGASGSGKSTLLHTLAGLDAPTGGRVNLLGTAITLMTPAKRAKFRSRNVGFIFQDYNLIASLTAAENVSMPSRLAGRPLGKRRTVAALEAVPARRRERWLRRLSAVRKCRRSHCLRSAFVVGAWGTISPAGVRVAVPGVRVRGPVGSGRLGAGRLLVVLGGREIDAVGGVVAMSAEAVGVVMDVSCRGSCHESSSAECARGRPGASGSRSEAPGWMTEGSGPMRSVFAS